MARADTRLNNYRIVVVDGIRVGVVVEAEGKLSTYTYIHSHILILHIVEIHYCRDSQEVRLIGTHIRSTRHHIETAIVTPQTPQKTNIELAILLNSLVTATDRYSHIEAALLLARYARLSMDKRTATTVCLTAVRLTTIGGGWA